MPRTRLQVVMARAVELVLVLVQALVLVLVLELVRVLASAVMWRTKERRSTRRSSNGARYPRPLYRRPSAPLVQIPGLLQSSLAIVCPCTWLVSSRSLDQTCTLLTHTRYSCSYDRLVDVDNYHMDILGVAESCSRPLLAVAVRVWEHMRVIESLGLSLVNNLLFMAAIDNGYLDNSYHNSTYGVV